MTDDTSPPPVPLLAGRWARRALCFATLAILVCTLFPFEFFRHETAGRRLGPFWTWFGSYPDSFNDFAENILLFVPFGFALACLGAKRGWGSWRGPVIGLAGGAAFSYVVEFLQLFLPTRDSSWGDVVTNGLGSLFGYLFFDSIGPWMLLSAAHLERELDRILSARRLAWIFVAYVGLGCVVSAVALGSASLKGWNPSDTLRCPGKVLPRKAWAGTIESVELVPGVAGREPPSAGTLESSATVPLDLVPEIRRTNRFALHVGCESTSASARGLMLELRNSHPPDDFSLLQHGRAAVFSLRMPDLGRSIRWELEFKNAFETVGPHEINVTFDGSTLGGSLDGHAAEHPVHISPGPLLVRRFKGVGPRSIPGYATLYAIMVFMPLGGLLALAARQQPRRQSWVGLSLGVLIPALLQQGILGFTTHAPLHPENALLGICLSVGAWLIVNSDPPLRIPPQTLPN